MHIKKPGTRSTGTGLLFLQDLIIQVASSKHHHRTIVRLMLENLRVFRLFTNYSFASGVVILLVVLWNYVYS